MDNFEIFEIFGESFRQNPHRETVFRALRWCLHNLTQVAADALDGKLPPEEEKARMAFSGVLCKVLLDLIEDPNTLYDSHAIVDQFLNHARRFTHEMERRRGNV